MARRAPVTLGGRDRSGLRHLRARRLAFETTLFADLVATIRAGPPPGFFRIGWVRRVPNLNEYFVHHEDVRRANGRGPRPIWFGRCNVTPRGRHPSSLQATSRPGDVHASFCYLSRHSLSRATVQPGPSTGEPTPGWMGRRCTRYVVKGMKCVIEMRPDSRPFVRLLSECRSSQTFW